MSERTHAPRHEQHKPKQHVEHEAKHETAKPKHENEKRKEKTERTPLPELKRQVKHEALPAEDVISINEKETPQSAYIGRNIKQQTFHRTLTRIRKQLSAPNKALSEVIHQPAVDAVSQVGSQTIARPSGILGGSICAFAGSTIFLLMARHYGFQYNYLLFVFLFVGGFAVGMILELALFALRRKKT